MLLLWVLLWAQAQSRPVLPSEFVLARPGNPPATLPVYRKQQSAPDSASDSFSAQLGVTIWRLRPARPSDSAARLAASEHQSPATEWVPERVSSGEALQEGDKIRISFEASRPGYLYVIDREEYAQGALGDTFLIFPTMRTRGGDNDVSPGKLVDILAPEDQPNYLTLHKIKPTHLGELLTIILTPEPITEFATGANALHLDEKMAARWEAQWASKVEIYDLEGGAGQPWTQAEQQAALPGNTRLQATDPPPQTIFATNTPRGSPVLIHLRLHYETAVKR